ncbi:MAG: LysM peptidoglycan-binding domain-containing protein [bacterium]|nr:LysM peptidoglycan-binding domain-containing protein [bacterium]
MPSPDRFVPGRSNISFPAGPDRPSGRSDKLPHISAFTMRAWLALAAAVGYGSIENIAAAQPPATTEVGIQIQNGATSTSFNEIDPAAKPPTTTYTVKAGDTLFQIARRHGCPMPDIVAVNPNIDPSLIYPGQEITLPSSCDTDNNSHQYTIQPGDTLFGIASKFGLSVETLQKENGITDPDHIRAGDKLWIPETNSLDTLETPSAPNSAESLASPAPKESSPSRPSPKPEASPSPVSSERPSVDQRSFPEPKSVKDTLIGMAETVIAGLAGFAVLKKLFKSNILGRIIFSKKAMPFEALGAAGITAYAAREAILLKLHQLAPPVLEAAKQALIVGGYITLGTAVILAMAYRLIRKNRIRF